MPTPVAPELLSILRCPRCRGQLRVTDGERPTLDCAPCGLRFPVRDGIPIMLIDQAGPA
jgi:uncharacterized protein